MFARTLFYNCHIVRAAAEAGVYAVNMLLCVREAAPVAQMAEQLAFNQWVAGSNPAGGICFLFK